jgi:hypothetical protein
MMLMEMEIVIIAALELPGLIATQTPIVLQAMPAVQMTVFLIPSI